MGGNLGGHLRFPPITPAQAGNSTHVLLSALSYGVGGLGALKEQAGGEATWRGGGPETRGGPAESSLPAIPVKMADVQVSDLGCSSPTEPLEDGSPS